jgi:P27 family predicted phage terminase small subunit
MRGRKPLPTSVRELTGNAGKRPINDREPAPPAPTPSTFDTAPPELTQPNAKGEISFPHGAAEWTRLAPMLRVARQITDADRSALLALCIEWDRYLTATAHVSQIGLVVKTKTGYLMTNPYLSIATRALAGCSRLWVELGLTPSSRSRVTTADGPGPGGDSFSEFDDDAPLTH